MGQAHQPHQDQESESAGKVRAWSPHHKHTRVKDNRRTQSEPLCLNLGVGGNLVMPLPHVSTYAHPQSVLAAPHFHQLC